MILTIILANAAVIFAFLAGATSNTLSRSEPKSKLFTVIAIIALALAVMLVARSGLTT